MTRFDLTGHVALITGGSRGLGLQIAHGYIEAGARVILTARKTNELDAAKAALEAAGGTVAVLPCDLSDFEAIPGVVDQAIAAFGRLDILVNNAGTSWGAPMDSYPLAGWNKVMDLNITAPFLLTQEIGRRCFIPNTAGKILNIASIGGLRGNPANREMYTIAYNASKAAMINFTRALQYQCERAGTGVLSLKDVRGSDRSAERHRIAGDPAGPVWW
jgi:NAD(P)-dependent dehydrogenase (short-subunit alcohol dehydrogenase family)